MIKRAAQIICVVCIAFSAFLGFYMTSFMGRGSEDVGVEMVRLLYEYESLDELYGRLDAIERMCTEEACAILTPDNAEHFEGAWERTGNLPTRVRIVWARPGMVVYALETEAQRQADLWCFSYELHKGLFDNVREYKLSATRRDAKGGLF